MTSTIGPINIKAFTNSRRITLIMYKSRLRYTYHIDIRLGENESKLINLL